MNNSSKKYISFIIFILIFFNFNVEQIISDNSVFIPGASNKYNSQEAIDKIMKAKRVKLEEMEKENEKIREKEKVLNKIKEKTVLLQNHAKNLYGFRAPFNDKISQSSNENAFSANVTRDVDVNEYSIKIINKAKSHKVTSKPLDKQYKIPGGNYNIQLGKDKIKISFAGGSLEEFAKKIKKDAKNKLMASVTWNTPNTQILILQGNETGIKKRISFIDKKTKELFQKMDFFKDVSAYDKLFKIDKNNLVNLSTTKKEPVFIKNGTLLVDKNESYRYNLIEKIPYRKSLIMEIDLRLEEVDLSTQKKRLIPTGPNFSKYGDINLFDIYVEGEASMVHIPPYSKPVKPIIVEDDHYLEVITNKKEIKLEELELESNNKTLHFDMSSIIDKNENIQALIFKNNNTFKKLEVRNIHFYDKDSKSGIRFTHELSKPEDALLFLDGIKIQRDTNIIDDLIKGLTLNIFNKTNKEETLKIDRDYEKIVGSVTGFLGEYNGFIELVNKETSVKPDAKGNAGQFVSDYSFISLVSKLRNIMMNSYPTICKEKLSLLHQIGVSTNASGSNRMDKNKLKGILEVNEDVFLEKMEKYPDGVKELFGNDNDGDLLVDSGVAYEVEILLKVYTMKNRGFFDNRNNNLERQVENNEKEIVSYKEKLKKDEQKLKADFYKMGRAAQELEESMKKFDNFKKQNR